MSSKKMAPKKKPKSKVDADETEDQSTSEKNAGVEEATKADIPTEPMAKTEPWSEDEKSGISVKIDPHCTYCGGIIYSGKAIVCHCGELVHQFCFNSHAMTKHQPAYKIVEIKTKTIYGEDGAYLGQEATYTEVANV